MKKIKTKKSLLWNLGLYWIWIAPGNIYRKEWFGYLKRTEQSSWASASRDSKGVCGLAIGKPRETWSELERRDLEY